MKDRSHDDAMAELFQQDPAYAVDLVNSILDDGDQDDLQIAFRQMDKAGLFDRAGVLYEVACDVLGSIIVDPSNAEAIKAVIQQYGPQARKLFRRVRATAPWRVATVEALPAFRLHVRFVDGTEGTVDLTALIQSPGAGVFAALADPSFFAQVLVEHGAVTWPGEIDLAPDAMYTAIKKAGTWVLQRDAVEGIAEDHAEIIRLSPPDQQRFAEVLLSPPEPTPALKRAMARHDKLPHRASLRAAPDSAGLFDRTGVRYEVACDVLGAIIAHHSETLALEHEKPIPDDAVVARIEADKRALRALRDNLDPKDATAIETVIQQYGPQARELFTREALADVDAGRIIDHLAVQEQVDNLDADVPAMTVAELIEHLRRFPADMPVLVQGYETGWDRIQVLREAPVALFKKAHEWDGEYKEAKEFKHPGESFSAVLIEGRRGKHR